MFQLAYNLAYSIARGRPEEQRGTVLVFGYRQVCAPDPQEASAPIGALQHRAAAGYHYRFASFRAES